MNNYTLTKPIYLTQRTESILLDEKKDEPVFLWIIICWLCAILYFDPRLFALTYAAPNFLARICVVIFVLCLDIFWLYAIYNTTMILASLWLRRQTFEPDLPSLTDFPKTAILYTTRNDFRKEAVETYLDLDYPNFHIFILDDSTLPEYCLEVDQWSKKYPHNVTVIRRPDRRAFKAGNLNHALRQIQHEYPFFAVCDSDGPLPKKFIGSLLPYFKAYPDAAFIQTAQEHDPFQKDPFGQAMGPMVSQHYRYFVKTKNRFGFVMFYGHGALIKTEVWQKMGGFPELVAEDLAFAAKARELGYRGIYTERVTCSEDFPPTYGRLRIRTEKWITATSEFIKKGYASFFRARHIPWFEKMDVIISACSHYQTSIMLLFLLMLGTLMPTYYSNFRYPGSFLLMPVPQGKSVFEYLIHIRYHIFWSLDFYFMMALSILAPTIPAIIDLYKKPVRLFQYLALSNFVFMGSLVTEASAVIVFLLTGKAVFRNTHSHSAAKERQDLIAKFFSFHPNSGAVFLSEVLMGLVLFALGVQTKNLWFMAPAAAMVLSPLFYRTGWKGWIKPFTAIPFLIGTLIFVLVSLDLWMCWSQRI